MRTGFSLRQDDTQGIEDKYLQSIVDIVQPVFEEGLVLAAQYCKACGRDVLLDDDIEYALKYCVMHRVGVNIGSIIPDTVSDDDDSDSDFEAVDTEDCPKFVRYSGDDITFQNINKAHDEWNSWNPESPIQQFLKDAIDKNDFTEYARGLESDSE